MDEECPTFYKTLDIYRRFLECMRSIEYKDVADSIVYFLRENENEKPKIISIGRGRTGLSGISGLQELYNYTEGTKYEFIPYSMEKDPINRYLRESDLVLIESGSGRTKETLDDFERAIEAGANCITIVGKEDSEIYELSEKYDFPRIVLEMEKTKDNERYSPMGSEFEFKYWSLLRCLIPTIVDKLELDFLSETQRERLNLNKNDLFESCLKLYEENSKFLSEIEDENISNWINRLTDRYGHLVLDGAGQSAHVAEQFEMRLRHLGYEPFMHKDSNRRVYRKGSCYIPVTGSGNTSNLVKRARDDAMKKGADVMPITANPESELANLVKDGYTLYIPVLPEFREYLKNHSSDERISPPKGHISRIPLFETNTYITTNAIVSQVAENEGKELRYMERSHV